MIKILQHSLEEVKFYENLNIGKIPISELYINAGSYTVILARFQKRQSTRQIRRKPWSLI